MVCLLSKKEKEKKTQNLSLTTSLPAILWMSPLAEGKASWVTVSRSLRWWAGKTLGSRLSGSESCLEEKKKEVSEKNRAVFCPPFFFFFFIIFFEFFFSYRKHQAAVSKKKERKKRASDANFSKKGGTTVG